MPEVTGQIVMDFSRATRRSHPVTSHVAEDEITKSGKREKHCQIILKALRLHNGSTSAELARFTSLTKEQVHKRMNDLVEHNLIEHGDKRVCDVKGSLCITWWIK